jgi:HAD superfamily hydrolase (TIGR01484 family)
MSLDAIPLTPLADRQFVLATDLDGTFLGGTQRDRLALYRWIEGNRETVGLVFVTGRDPAFIVQMCQDCLPWPDYVIGDVGTTIAHVADGGIHPIPSLEAEIAARWNGSGPRITAALNDHPGLSIQTTVFRYRVSYDMDPAAFDPAAKGVVEGLGLDWLISDNRFFDVLPRGVSKGPSVRRLADHLSLEPSRVLVAGDTLNDLSMLEAGLPAVAVGGSEPALLERVRDLDHVHKARAVGAAGIAEAIAAFNLHPIGKDI